MNKSGIELAPHLSWGMIVLTLLTGCTPKQVPDKSYRPDVVNPAYQFGAGPRVSLDEAHHNFHTLHNRFWAFGELLRRDGYVLESTRDTFDAAMLSRCGILVISNAQLDIHDWEDYPYPTPSAFTAAEIDAVRTWVEDGGSLLLIADHMPFAGAASDLAAAFGVTFHDGYAVPRFDNLAQLDAAFDQWTVFSLEDNTLVPSAITRGRSSTESVTSVRSFNGQAFHASPSADPVLVLPEGYVQLMPEKACEFLPDTKTIPVDGWLQGAVIRSGKGRAAFFGEAAMFSAQLSAGEPMGMNAPGAEQNNRFVLNVMHWLSGILN